MAKAPTLLDANNYLIPTSEQINKGLQTDSFGVIHKGPTRTVTDNNDQNYDVYIHNMYAPIFSQTPDSIFRTEDDIQTVLNTYLDAQEQAIFKYIDSMSLAAQKMYMNNASTNTGQNLAIDAARGISDIPDNILNGGDVTGQICILLPR